jgi:hypothetical protein
MSINPTFLLRGVDPVASLEAYKSGKYSRVTEPPSSVSPVGPVSLVINNSGPDSEFYTYRNKNNSHMHVITTNHKAYRAVIDNVPYLPKCCLWCRGPIEADPIGIPTKLVVDSDNNYIFFLDRPSYCSFECCFAEICRDNLRCVRDPLHGDSEVLLKFFFRLATGQEELRAAPDWWLLDTNGGPLSREEYRLHRYTRTPNIVTLPIKVSYML